MDKIAKKIMREIIKFHHINPDQMSMHARKRIRQIVQEHLTKEEPVCKACLWKGKHSVYTQEIWAEDFWWDWYVKQPEIKMVNCKRCDGKGKEEPEEFKLPWNCPYCQTRLEFPSPIPQLKIEKLDLKQRMTDHVSFNVEIAIQDKLNEIIHVVNKILSDKNK